MTRSRQFGKANRSLSSLGQFNNVNILVIDSTHFYVLDGTKKNLSYKTPPLEVLNRDVFLVDTFRMQWINIIDPSPFLKNNITIKAEMDSTGNIYGDAYISYFDFLKDQLVSKKEFKGEVEEGEEEETQINFLQKRTTNIKIDSITEENEKNELKPLTQNFHFNYKPDLVSEFLFLDPFFLSPFRKNPFSDSIRRTDIDFGSNQFYSINIHFTLPYNFVVEEIPKNLIFITNDTSMIFKRQTIHEGDIFVFRYSFEIKRAIFSKDEYPAVQEYFRKIYGVIQEHLILKKK